MQTLMIFYQIYLKNPEKLTFESDKTNRNPFDDEFADPGRLAGERKAP
jgi:hypothetical protein